MTTAISHTLLVLSPLVFLGGCKDDPLDERQHIAGWANAASAMGVFTHGYEPLAFADGEVTFEDPNCPSTSDDGQTVRIVGNGCTDSKGVTWSGSATVVRDGSDRSLTMEEYGKSDDPSFLARVSGRFDVAQIAADEYSFEVDIEQRGGLYTRIDYAGRVQGSYQGATLWNGAGTVHREGLTIDSGTVEAATVNQLRDNEICAGEAASGTTTLVSNKHRVVISYDGANDCDEENSARWSRDGQDQGVVGGVVCSAGSDGASGRQGLIFVASLILALLLTTRRARA